MKYNSNITDLKCINFDTWCDVKQNFLFKEYFLYKWHLSKNMCFLRRVIYGSVKYVHLVKGNNGIEYIESTYCMLLSKIL